MISTIVGFLLVWALCRVEAQTKSPTTPTAPPTQAPIPYDAKVGTAFAPTTRGGACLNQQDYSLWTVNGPDGQNGFDHFPEDLQACSLRCIVFTTSSQSVEYNCGQALSGVSCPEFLYAICVRDCMARQPILTNRSDFPVLKSNGAYTVECASCMGNVSYCATQSCFSSCIFGNENVPCKQCNELYCNPPFMVCAGLNIDQKLPAPFDFTGVIIGAVSAGAGLLLGAGFVGYRYRLKTRKHREMSMAELAKLASSPNNLVGMRYSLGADTERGSFPIEKKQPLRREKNKDETPANKKNNNARLSLLSPVQPVQVNLSPYQQQFEAQQRANPANKPGKKPAPSARMSVLASDPSSAGKNGGTALVMLWTFRGDRPDELTVEIGTKITGLEMADGWWLAQLKDGRVGLVPVSYTAHDVPSKRAYPTKTVPPSQRISRYQVSLKASPSQHVMQMPVTPLIVTFDFNPESIDEFEAKEGMVVMGIHEQDGWYLVRTESGDRMGLIPSSYVERIIASTSLPNPTGSLPYQREPEF